MRRKAARVCWSAGVRCGQPPAPVHRSAGREMSSWSPERVSPVLKLLAYMWTLPILRELSAGQVPRVDLLHLTKWPDRTLTSTVRALQRAGLADVQTTGGVRARKVSA
jgi:DNA-binding HxlR family transcriptional regulator